MLVQAVLQAHAQAAADTAEAVPAVAAVASAVAAQAVQADLAVAQAAAAVSLVDPEADPVALPDAVALVALVAQDAVDNVHRSVGHVVVVGTWTSLSRPR